MTTSGRTAKVGGSSSMPGYSGAQWAGGASWVPNWSVAIEYRVASKASFAYVYGWPVSGFSVGLNVAGPKPFHTGMFGVMVCVRSMYLALASTSLYIVQRSTGPWAAGGVAPAPMTSAAAASPPASLHPRILLPSRRTPSEEREI